MKLTTKPQGADAFQQAVPAQTPHPTSHSPPGAMASSSSSSAVDKTQFPALETMAEQFGSLAKLQSNPKKRWADYPSWEEEEAEWADALLQQELSWGNFDEDWQGDMSEFGWPPGYKDRDSQSGSFGAR